MSLSKFVGELKQLGMVKSLEKVLQRELEPTRYLRESDVEGKTLLFRVVGSDVICAGNVVNTRYKLYRALYASSDEDAYTKLLKALESPTKPREGDFNNYYEEKKEVSLNRLPFIKFYPGDGGYYITSSIFISCIELEGREVCNASVHRTMLIDEKKVVARIVPRHLRYIYNMYSERGLETPVAIVVGIHPAIMLAAASSPEFGVFELWCAASLLPELVVVRTPKYGIPVPARASLVIEGRITRRFAKEGPFVDLTGTYDRVRQEPLIEVENVYMGNELFHIILPGGDEHMLLQGFSREASIWRAVRHVVPKVRKVRLTPGGGRWLHAVISISKLSDGDPKVVGMAAFAAHPSLKTVIVVDEDIDPDDLLSVEWALATRFQASKDLAVIKDVRCSTLDPSSKDGICDKVIIDATAPLAEKDRFRKVEL
ncbi:MAG: UbiD family decarboxylase [Thermoprotei archaeon]|nr:MAG: UbiD family decarboxylase [Thermoprotei archaeon]